MGERSVEDRMGEALRWLKRQFFYPCDCGGAIRLGDCMLCGKGGWFWQRPEEGDSTDA